MTIEEAVKVLNERKHRSFSDWYQAGNAVYPPFSDEFLFVFEAIAIAEKYQRKPDA